MGFRAVFCREHRDIAKRLAELIAAREVSVWYDYDDQHLILAENVEDYLAPIYRSEASYVIALLSKEYPRKIWTKFESDNFKARFGDNAVIPISFSDAPAGFFSVVNEKGGLYLRVDGDVEAQLVEFAEVLCKRIGVDRHETREADAQLDAADKIALS